jgi:succinate dehydrogenase / fumarate reductase iron-sulfur subunit
MTETRRLRVYRYKRDGGPERIDEFDVPVGPHTTILDALRWIRLHRDPSLMLRHSCMHASCGTCGVQVDGRERLACVCDVADLGAVITVEPLANLPVLGDLVVDMGDFFARFPEPHPIIRSVAEGEPHVRLEDCIECGLCLSACPIAASSRRYAGPAALVAAERLLEEPRGAEPGDVLAWAGRPGGAWQCHLGLECAKACPADALPVERIMALRHALTESGG